MYFSTGRVRQGETSERHFVAKMVAISTITSFFALMLISFGF